MDDIDAIDHLGTTWTRKCLAKRKQLLILHHTNQSCGHNPCSDVSTCHLVIDPFIFIHKHASKLFTKQRSTCSSMSEQNNINSSTYNLKMHCRSSKARESKVPTTVEHISPSTGIGRPPFFGAHSVAQGSNNR